MNSAFSRNHRVNPTLNLAKTGAEAAKAGCKVSTGKAPLLWVRGVLKSCGSKCARTSGRVHRPLMEIQQQIPEALSLRAKSLEPLGLHEVAWAKSDALELLAQLAGKRVAVLGGDVYSVFSSGLLKPAYENWSSERRPGEELRAYAERSQQEAVAFLRAYPDLPETLFSLVLSEDETAGL